MKRLLDLAASGIGLLILSPIIGILCLLVWGQDFRSPFYIAPRAGRGGRPFRMVKLRSMVMGADRIGGSSTAANDRRITWVGRFIRRFKFDELMQLWNVLRGDMSLVGPRPQVLPAVAAYTEAERGMLDVRPGITDLASIVFSDEGDILKQAADPDLRYEQIIRPWKSRLALVYVRVPGVWLDLRIIVLTIVAIVSRPTALRGIQRLLARLDVDSEVMRVARRAEPLPEAPPPGATEVVRAVPA